MKYSVEITGPALSFLYFTSSAATSANEGLLIGNIEEKQTEFISDSNEAGMKNETIIRISGIYALPEEPRSFYTNDGNLNDEVLLNWSNQLQEGSQSKTQTKIVGWYSCRTNSQFKPSLRETALHDQLSLKFGHQSANNFIFVLVQNWVNSNSYVREFQSKFLQMVLANDSKKRNWSLLNGKILNWNQNTDSRTYRSLPTLGYEFINCSTKELKRSGQDDSELVANISKKGHNFVIESMHKIAKLSAKIGSIESEISNLQKMRNNADYDGDEMIAPDSSEVYRIPSPPISSRRRPGSSSVEGTPDLVSSPNRR